MRTTRVEQIFKITEPDNTGQIPTEVASVIVSYWNDGKKPDRVYFQEDYPKNISIEEMERRSKSLNPRRSPDEIRRIVNLLESSLEQQTL